MDKWLKSKALAVAIEMVNNTTNGGKTLEEFAEYTGRQGGEDVLYFIFKNVAEHVKFCVENPEIAEDVNELRYHL
jgi:hypothetical protein|tara:strand:+ start:704 stop:928 length:225 start_codon:yes stop_codon:yes gene_type:complete